jgi:integrase
VIYKRGRKGIYWYRFMWRGELIRESTHQTNDKVARQMESAHRTSLAKGQVGIREKKPAPTLDEFCKYRFEPWAKASFEKNMPANWLWYRAGIRALLSYKQLSKSRLDAIGTELVAEYAAHRQSDGKQISTVNSALRVLRRILRLAVEWGMIEAAPTILLLPGERHRETVVTHEQEQKYLEHCPEPLKSIATVLADSGMRPEECYRMRWENINWQHGRNGAVLVTHGKTAAARRSIPMTPRVRFILDARWEFAEKPAYGWVCPLRRSAVTSTMPV